ncbi:MAG: GTPase [Pseudomonadota bacterium]
MAVEWLLPAAKEAYKHREVGFSTWDGFVENVFGPKTRIAIVGPQGIGKSVLLDHLTGKARKKNYQSPGKSSKAEPGRIKAGDNRLAITVAPGAGGPQVDTFNEVFNADDPVDGVIFVAASGLVTLREENAVEANISRGYRSIDDWRALNVGGEIEYLKEVAAKIRSTKAKNRRPRWLLVAATKTDLYYDDVSEEEKFYSPHFESNFSNVLHTLRCDVGRDNFEWEAVPVCSQMDDFIWGEQSLTSQLSSEDRDHYLAQMTRRLGELCR